jgi:hypothetical protein
MATKEKTEVASVKQSAQLPAGMADMEELMRDAGSGVESMGMDDIAVPFLYILQSNSPQVNEDADTYVKGAKAGMFYNNVSNEIYDGRETGLTVIPCAYERKYVEWIDRDEGGGGYVADHDIESGILSECKPNAKGIPVLGNGHLIIETAYHYVYFKNPLTGVWEEIIIPMKSTFLKKSRRWNKTLMATLIPGTSSRAPRWLYPYQLKTVKETKNTNTWSNFDISRLEEMVSADQYRSAKKFAELMQSGLLVKAKESNVGAVAEDSGGRSDDDDDDRNRVGGGKDEMPF